LHRYGLQSADTVVFSIGVQMGALGVLLYLLIFALIWKHGLGIYRALSDPFLKSVAAGILGYLAAMTFSNFVAGSPSAYPVVDFYFWLFVGVLMSLKRVEETVAR
jgi:cell division protein FtsW (lipid II flippase)